MLFMMTENQYNFVSTVGAIALMLLAIGTATAIFAIIANTIDKKPYLVKVSAIITVLCSIVLILGLIGYFFLLGSEWAN